MTLATLVQDIYRVANEGMPEALQGEASDKLLVEYATRMGEFMGKKVYAEDRGVKDKSDLTIRMSELGTPCQRQLLLKWYGPQYGKPPYTYKPDPALGVKFGYGYLVEEMILTMAALSGHDVKDQQRKVTMPIHAKWTLTGSIDAIIDNTAVDVKSMSKFAFDKYAKEGFTDTNDSFGYSWQLNGYDAALRMEGEHLELPQFVTVEKETGRINVVAPRKLLAADIVARGHSIALNAERFHTTGKLPAVLGTKPHALGNALDVVCSYCNFKHVCFPNLVTFVEKGKPVNIAAVNAKGEAFAKANPTSIWASPKEKAPSFT